MEFLKFFSLKEDPFKLLPDPAFFYPSSCHHEGLQLMDYAVDQKEGFLLVIGEPGTGKTTLLRVFLGKWKSKAEIAIVLTPRLSPEEFLIAVADDLEINTENKNKHEIISALRDFITEKSSEGKKVIIIVDEAQNLPPDTLEELRLLSNLETEKEKLLQIILLGQPELETLLMKEQLRQLNQRIATRIHLKHLSSEETADYINHRIIKAGRENLKIHKKVGCITYRLTRGVPRLINMLISRALMAAYLEGSNTVFSRHISYARKSLNHKELKMQRRPWLVPVAAGLVAALLGAGIYGYTQNYGIFQNDEKISSKGTIEKKESVSTPDIKSEIVKFVSVNIDAANIRKGPSINAKRAGWSRKGNSFVVLSEERDDRGVNWYEVSFEGKSRWISGEAVRIVESVAQSG
jgi:general secretion pathway protein A